MGKHVTEDPHMVIHRFLVQSYQVAELMAPLKFT